MRFKVVFHQEEAITKRHAITIDYRRGEGWGWSVCRRTTVGGALVAAHTARSYVAAIAEAKACVKADRRKS